MKPWMGRRRHRGQRWGNSNERKPLLPVSITPYKYKLRENEEKQKNKCNCQREQHREGWEQNGVDLLCKGRIRRRSAFQTNQNGCECAVWEKNNSRMSTTLAAKYSIHLLLSKGAFLYQRMKIYGIDYSVFIGNILSFLTTLWRKELFISMSCNRKSVIIILTSLLRS